MTDNQEPDRPFLTRFQSMKAYHRPRWEAYARKAEAEREIERRNARIVLKEKRMKVGDTLYTFTVKQGKNGKPYLVISGNIEKLNYRGSIVVFAPYRGCINKNELSGVVRALMVR
jgi:hypothetical protein